MFSDVSQNKPVIEKMDVLMTKIGLSDQKPVPEPVKFSEGDPLGSNLLKSATSSGDVLMTLCMSGSLYTMILIDLFDLNFKTKLVNWVGLKQSPMDNWFWFII